MPASATSWETWTDANKLKLLGELKARQWRQKANPGQLAPDGPWKVWWARGGRGAGKTRTGAEWLTEQILAQPATPDDPMPEWGIIAPTRGQARAICVEGESGLLRVLGPAVDNWNRSDGELWCKNGAVVRIDGSDYGGERLEGKNLRGAWADEIGKWKKPEQAWKEALWFTVRKGPNPRIIATGTPKGKKGVVKILLDAPDILAMTHLLVQNNKANLAPGFYEENLALYAGTRLERQEIHGEILEEVEGALWNWAMLEDGRVDVEWAESLRDVELGRCVVAIDPAASSNEDSDETGISVCQILKPEGALRLAGVAEDFQDYPQTTHALVWKDASDRLTPHGWASKAIALYYAHGADRIVYERNQGGEMIADVIRNVDPNVPLKGVWASRGKHTRAEPISALYEQGRIHHVGVLPKLEDEQTTWVPGEDSPSRMDALVWALTELFIEGGGTIDLPEPLAMDAPLTAGIMDRQF